MSVVNNQVNIFLLLEITTAILHDLKETTIISRRTCRISSRSNSRGKFLYHNTLNETSCLTYLDILTGFGSSRNNRNLFPDKHLTTEHNWKSADNSLTHHLLLCVGIVNMVAHHSWKGNIHRSCSTCIIDHTCDSRRESFNPTSIRPNALPRNRIRNSKVSSRPVGKNGVTLNDTNGG